MSALPDGNHTEWAIAQRTLRAIGERLVEKGWASRVLTTSQDVSIELSGNGIDGMNAVRAALEELDPCTMKPEHMLGLWTLLSTRDADGSEYAAGV